MIDEPMYWKPMIWHYAVYKGGSYFIPACVGHREDMKPDTVHHGITRLRGDVTCEKCLKAMGLT